MLMGIYRYSIHRYIGAVLIALLLGIAIAMAANEPINVDTKTHKVTTPTTIDFGNVAVLGVSASVNITATAPIIVTPTPLINTGTISLNATSKTNWDTAYTDRMKWDGGAGAWLNPATGRTSLGLGSAALADASSFKSAFTFAQSLSQALEGTTATLVNDAATPGNSKYYGTDSGGAKGWFALPASGGVTSVFTRTGAVVAESGDYSAFYQPLDSDLTAIAGLATAPFGRGLLPQVDAFGVRSYIGAGTGNGTVTNFSAGDLSPLFTTSEATTSTTPALSFALSTAAANTVFGNATGSTAAPTFSSSPRFTAIGNLTSNGFIKTSGSVGTLSVDTATYLTGNQSISLTGDITGSGTTSIATTYNNAVPTAKAGLPTGGTANQVLSKIDATNYNTQWVTPSAGGGTPAGASGDVQWNNGGSFGGGSNVKRDVNSLWIGGGSPVGGNPLTVNTSALGIGFAVVAGSGSGNSPQFSLYEGSTQKVALGLTLGAGHYSTVASPNDGVLRTLAGNLILSTENFGTGKIIFTNINNNYQMQLLNSGLLGFSTTSATPDIAIGRNAAGVLEINNGTAGQYRDVKVRTVLFGTAPATLQTGNLANTAGTGSGTQVMAGLGSVTYLTAVITPRVSGKISVTINGNLLNTSASGGVSCQMRYGTGTAPANGAAVTGTVIGGKANRGLLAATVQVPFSLSAVITGLAVGTTYWLDVDYSTAGTTGSAALYDTSVQAFEIL